MTATIQLTLPMPPSGNHRNVGSGKHTRHSPEYTAFLEAVGWCALAAGAVPAEGPVRVHVDIYYRRAVDADNVLKPVHDALQGYAYLNDAQIVAGSYTRQQDKRNPRVEVTISPCLLTQEVNS